MSVIDSIELVVTPKMGVAWGDVAKECMEIACREWRNVTLIFNGGKFIIRPNDLLGSIKEEKEA